MGIYTASCPRVSRQANHIDNEPQNKLIVFSDLDGTLLDHDTYDWAPARPALSALRRRDCPVVLVSSKTLTELEDYRANMALRHPVVAENGAIIDVPATYFPDATLLPDIVMRAELQSAFEEIRHAGAFRCKAFYELGVPGIIESTGLDETQALRANDRKASEPILWLDSDERLADFEQAVDARSLRCIRGGRFLHLMGNTGKEEAVRELLDAYAQKYPGAELTSVSLGDAPNDLGMLSSTDIAVIIPAKHSHRMTLTAANRVLRPTSPGPAGWNEAMQALLDELK